MVAMFPGQVEFGSAMTEMRREFIRRVGTVPGHGLGLSVDVYSPDLFELVDALQVRQLTLGYLEIFKAATPALRAVRKRWPAARLAYHSEGVWLTQPDLQSAYPWEEEVHTACEHAQVLGSAWITHEGAAKQMAGYSFGTYLPPLFTPTGADVMARNVSLVQGTLDGLCRDRGLASPLLLVETPPLTYFGLGSLSMADFFRRVTDLTSCGLVLDIGHVWTVFRYSGAWRTRSLPQFLGEFLETLPLERVVEIHVAGLAPHDSQGFQGEAGDPACPGDVGRSVPPWWIDAHGAPIPALLFDMLDQVLAHPRLVHLKGLALEVDTKPIHLIVDEFSRFSERFGRPMERAEGDQVQGEATFISESREGGPEPSPTVPWRLFEPGGTELQDQYTRYARVVSGQAGVEEPVWDFDPEALTHYRQRYLPHEILEWGGEVRAMFPDTCRQLTAAGLSLEAFVGFWFKAARRNVQPYDFFLLKLDRFQEFVNEVLPSAKTTAARESADLREAYQRANEEVGG